MDFIQDQDKEQTPLSVISNIKKPLFMIRLSMVALVYTLQGATLEFLQFSVQTQLVLKGASFSQLAVLSTMEYPWCFKFLWGPFQDAFFFTQIGRRKTWVLGTLISLAILWGVLSFKIEQLVDNLDVTFLAIIGIITSIFITSQDVSMDGWVVKLSDSDQEMSKFSWWCSFGYSLGGLASFTLYMWLSSDIWCNQYLNRSSLIDSQQLVTTVSICFIVVTILVGFMREDKDSMELALIDNKEYLSDNNQQNQEDPLSTSQINNFQKVLRKISNVFKNRNIISMTVFLLFSDIGFAYFDNVGYVEILNRGVSANVVAFYWLIATICEGITGYIVANFCAGHQIKIYLASFVLRTFNGGFYSFIIYQLNNKSISYSTTVILFGIQLCITEIGIAMTMVSLISFFMSVCDTEVEGSYLAILTSVLYTAPILTATCMYALSDFIEPASLIIFSLAWDVLYFGIFFQKVLKLQDLTKDEWALKENMSNETELGQLIPDGNQGFQRQKNDEKIEVQNNKD